MALLSGVTITISGCGGSPTEPSPSPAPTGGSSGSPDVSGVVSANHGHVATVTAAQITAANAVVLQIRGTADHSHTVELAMAEVVQIGARGRVSKSSSTDDGHNHVVTFN